MEFLDENYRDLCSMKTLYSTKEGFLSDFFFSLLQNVDELWINNVFNNKTSEENKIRICHGDKKLWSKLNNFFKNITKIYRKKCFETSKESKIQADFLFKTGEYKKSIMLYSQSIIRAPCCENKKSSDEYLLPLSYKGRANALYKLEKYKECLNDLNMALKEKFPESLKYKIFIDMGKCHENLGDKNKAKISLKIADKLLNEQLLNLKNLNQKENNKNNNFALKKTLINDKEEIKKIIDDLNTNTEKIKIENSVFNVPYEGEPLPKISGETNEIYPNASNLLKIRHGPDCGRFAAAANKIEIGDTIVVEEPQTSFLLPKMNSSHCHHCFTRLFAPIPCNTCSGVAFCSIKCRDSAVNSYHKYECELLGFFMGSGMSLISYLSLRMVTQEGLKFFKQLQTKLKQTEKSNVSCDFTIREKNYLNVYNLTTNSILRTSKDYFIRTVMAIFIVKSLKLTSYFEHPEKTGVSDDLTEDEILTASIILHHLELLQFNAHEIYETRVSELYKTENSKTVFIAIGVYPTVALFNHECSPSVTRYFSGKNIIIKAVRPLSKNDILSDNYGPHYAKKSLVERRRELTSRYWFHCRCQACIENWPLIQDININDFKIRCTSLGCENFFDLKNLKNNLKCWKCLKEIDVRNVKKKKSQADDLFTKSIELMDDKKCTNAVPFIISFLNKIFDLALQPCREIFLGQEALRTCYAQTGNLWILNE